MNPATESRNSIPNSGRRSAISFVLAPCSSAASAGGATASPPVSTAAAASAAAAAAASAFSLRGLDDGSVASVTAMMPKVTALSAKASVRSAAAMMMPASAGPMMNDELVHRREQAVGWSQLTLVADHRRQVGADRRAEEAREAGREDRERDDREERSVAGDDDRQGDHDQPAGDVRDEEHQAPVVAVDDDPGRDRQEHVRHDPGGADDAQQERIAALLVDHDEERDEVQPVADARDELARQQAHERAVGQDPTVCLQGTDGSTPPPPERGVARPGESGV